MIQTLWYCKDCELYHYGNCPQIKVTLTTFPPVEQELAELHKQLTREG